MSWLDSARNLFTRSKSLGPPVRASSVMTLFGDNSDLEKLGEYKGYVYAAVSKIAEDVASVELYVESFNPRTKEWQRLDSHDYLDVLGSGTSLFEKREAAQSYYETVGESFWLFDLRASGVPASSTILRPDWMSIKTNNQGEIDAFIYTRPDGSPIPLEPGEIGHFRSFNPVNRYRGYSPLEAAGIFIKTHKNSAQFVSDFFANNAMPTGVVGVKDKMDKDSFEAFKNQWKSSIGMGPGKSTTALINGDVEVKQIGLSIGDVDISALRDMSREDILTIYKISKPVLGIYEGVQRSNAESAEYMWSKVIEGKVRREIQTHNRLLKRFYPQQQLRMNYVSPVPEDLEQKLQVATQGQFKGLTINDTRKMLGLESLPQGDVVMVPINMMPLGAPAPQPKKTLKVMAKAADRDEQFRLASQHIQEKYEQKFVELVAPIIAKQQQDALAHYAPKKALQQLPQQDEQTELMVDATLPALIEMTKDQGKLTSDYVGSEVPYELTPGLQQYIAGSLKRAFNGLNETIINALSRTITEGVNDGDSLQLIKQRINAVFDKAAGYELDRVARTEVIKADNQTTQELYSRLGVKEKRWKAHAGACEFCRALDGRKVATLGSFITKGERFTGADGGTRTFDYENVEHPPVHPQCRCTIIAVREKP